MSKFQKKTFLENKDKDSKSLFQDSMVEDLISQVALLEELLLAWNMQPNTLRKESNLDNLFQLIKMFNLLLQKWPLILRQADLW